MYFGGNKKLIKELKFEALKKGKGDDGLMFGSGMKIPKWLNDISDFLQGKKKLKPHHLAKGMSKILNIASKLASKSENFAHTSENLKKGASLLDKASLEAKRLSGGKKMKGGDDDFYFGSGMKNKKTFQEGGRRHKIKEIVNGFVDFINGKKKVKPHGILQAAAVISGIGAVGAALIPGAQPIAAALGSTSIGLFGLGSKTKQLGSGRHLEGHGLIASKRKPRSKSLDEKIFDPLTFGAYGAAKHLPESVKTLGKITKGRGKHKKSPEEKGLQQEKQKGGIVFWRASVGKQAKRNFDSCKKSLNDAGYGGIFGARKRKKACWDAVNNYGRYASNYKGDDMSTATRLYQDTKRRVVGSGMHGSGLNPGGRGLNPGGSGLKPGGANVGYGLTP